jgi:hypothetical protein
MIPAKIQMASSKATNGRFCKSETGIKGSTVVSWMQKEARRASSDYPQVSRQLISILCASMRDDVANQRNGARRTNEVTNICNRWAIICAEDLILSNGDLGLVLKNCKVLSSVGDGWKHNPVSDFSTLAHCTLSTMRVLCSSGSQSRSVSHARCVMKHLARHGEESLQHSLPELKDDIAKYGKLPWAENLAKGRLYGAIQAGALLYGEQDKSRVGNAGQFSSQGTKLIGGLFDALSRLCEFSQGAVVERTTPAERQYLKERIGLWRSLYGERNNNRNTKAHRESDLFVVRAILEMVHGASKPLEALVHEAIGLEKLFADDFFPATSAPDYAKGMHTPDGGEKRKGTMAGVVAFLSSGVASNNTVNFLPNYFEKFYQMTKMGGDFTNTTVPVSSETTTTTTTTTNTRKEEKQKSKQNGVQRKNKRKRDCSPALPSLFFSATAIASSFSATTTTIGQSPKDKSLVAVVPIANNLADIDSIEGDPIVEMALAKLPCGSKPKCYIAKCLYSRSFYFIKCINEKKGIVSAQFQLAFDNIKEDLGLVPLHLVLGGGGNVGLDGKQPPSFIYCADLANRRVESNLKERPSNNPSVAVVTEGVLSVNESAAILTEAQVGQLFKVLLTRMALGISDTHGGNIGINAKTDEIVSFDEMCVSAQRRGLKYIKGNDGRLTVDVIRCLTVRAGFNASLTKKMKEFLKSKPKFMLNLIESQLQAVMKILLDSEKTEALYVSELRSALVNSIVWLRTLEKELKKDKVIQNKN